MRVAILSDIHLEFHNDGGKEFISNLDSSNVDLLILAGDTWELPQQNQAVKWICKKYPEVVFVLGNHNIWSSTKETINQSLRVLEKKYSNFHFLDNELIEINGQRILGGTMWFKQAPTYLEENWVDFYKIYDFKNWVYQSNAEFIKLLEDNLKEGDIVVTHHLPSEKSIAPIFKNSPTNCFFLCDVENLIIERNPKLWVHGHTHNSMDYQLNHCNTRVICNPYGYENYSTNSEFIKDLVVEV